MREQKNNRKPKTKLIRNFDYIITSGLALSYLHNDHGCLGYHNDGTPSYNGRDGVCVEWFYVVFSWLLNYDQL